MRTGREHTAELPEQLALDLEPPQPIDDASLIVSAANRDAAAFAARPELWPGPAACLTGPEGCGKTRIALARFYDAARLDARALCGDGAPAALSPQGAAGRFWFDDLDAALRDAPDPPHLESRLFHLINQLSVGGGSLLASGRTAPATWGLSLPDLESRLSAALVLRVEPPDDALLGAYLERCFQRRRLSAEPNLIEYLLRRIERSFAAAEQAADRLDRAALRTRRRIGLRLAADALNRQASP